MRRFILAFGAAALLALASVGSALARPPFNEGLIPASESVPNDVGLTFAQNAIDSVDFA